MIASLWMAWDLGEPLTARDAAARTFNHLFNLETPRAPDSWPDVSPLPVPPFQEERVAAREALSTLGHHLCHALVEHERELRGEAPTAVAADLPQMSPTLALDIVHRMGARLFPKLLPPHP
jgi:phospholipase C